MSYSTTYNNYHSQSLTNIQNAYNTGDRSEKIRRLTSTALRSLPPLELLEDPYTVKAIEYHKPGGITTDKDHGRAKTTMADDAGEKGWQFATQIDLGDDNENNFDQTNGNTLLE